MDFRKKLLWLDCCGGLIVGALVLVGCRLLTAWYNIPVSLIVVMGCANLIYGGFSLSLAAKQTRPVFLICMLAVANVAWGLSCFILTIVWWDSISFLGVIHLVGEGVYVGALGMLEWRWRSLLVANG